MVSSSFTKPSFSYVINPDDIRNRSGSWIFSPRTNFGHESCANSDSFCKLCFRAAKLTDEEVDPLVYSFYFLHPLSTYIKP
nr:MAG TPA: hypothetical protein [Caudoviricetes sp.]